MSSRAYAWVWNLHIPAMQKIVLLALAERTVESTSYPSLDTIAEDCGMSRRCVVNCLHKLEEAGYITHEKRYAPNGHRSSNVYTLNINSNGETEAFRAIAKAKKNQSAPDALRLSANNVQSAPDALRLSANNVQSAPDALPQSARRSPITETKPTSTNVEEAEASQTPPNFSWTVGVELLTGADMKEKPARALLGKLIKTYGEPAVEDALLATQAKEPVERVAYLHAVLKEQAARAKASPRVAAGDDWLERLL